MKAVKRLGQVGRPPGRGVFTVMTMIDQWIPDDERELEARCARFRLALLGLDRDGLPPDPHEPRQPDEAA
ncbi:hypothetical protein GCM10010176_099100 [Nonomuraea spiralis]|nr:hypothetical protein GCM10010176_099100 [Nonomuraea spiralis]